MEHIFTAAERDIEFRDVTSRASVPENDIAHLMYYLDCVQACLGEPLIDYRLRDYENYHRLNSDEKKAVHALAYLVAPHLLLGKMFFLVEDDSPILNGYSGRFYEIREATNILGGFVADEGVIVVKGQKVSVSKIMIYKESWVHTHFFEPMKRLIDSSELNAPKSAPRITAVSTSASHSRSSSRPRPTTSQFLFVSSSCFTLFLVILAISVPWYYFYLKFDATDGTTCAFWEYRHWYQSTCVRDTTTDRSEFDEDICGNVCEFVRDWRDVDTAGDISKMKEVYDATFGLMVVAFASSIITACLSAFIFKRLLPRWFRWVAIFFAVGTSLFLSLAVIVFPASLPEAQNEAYGNCETTVFECDKFIGSKSEDGFSSHSGPVAWWIALLATPPAALSALSSFFS